MSQQSIKPFLKVSELYLRLTDNQYSSFNIDEIEQLIISKNEPSSKVVEFSYRGYVAQIRQASAR